MMSGGWDRLLVCPLGSIVATCTLVDVVPTDDMDGFLSIGGCSDDAAPYDRWVADSDYSGRVWDLAANRPYGDFTPGRYAWLLADIVPVDPPVPFKGGQRLTKTWGGR